MSRRQQVYIKSGAAAGPFARSCGPTQKASGPADGRTGMLPCLPAAVQHAWARASASGRASSGWWSWSAGPGGWRTGADSPAPRTPAHARPPLQANDMPRPPATSDTLCSPAPASSVTLQSLLCARLLAGPPPAHARRRIVLHSTSAEPVLRVPGVRSALCSLPMAACRRDHDSRIIARPGGYLHATPTPTDAIDLSMHTTTPACLTRCHSANSALECAARGASHRSIEPTVAAAREGPGEGREKKKAQGNRPSWSHSAPPRNLPAPTTESRSRRVPGISLPSPCWAIRLVIGLVFWCFHRRAFS